MTIRLNREYASLKIPLKLAVLCLLINCNDTFALTQAEKVEAFFATMATVLYRGQHPSGVCLYTQSGFWGERICGTESQAVLDGVFDDNISSISIEPGYYVIAHKDPNFAGESEGFMAHAESISLLDNQGSSFTIVLEDDDQDGVHYSNDLCPDTPLDDQANLDGCGLTQIDTDGDGVFDAYDFCASTNQGEQVDIQGCSETQDSDGDGIPNNIDSYPHQTTLQCIP